MAIVILFVAHWVLSAFFQSSFHHRYASHRMFTMAPRCRARVLTAHVRDAGLVVPLAARVRDAPPRAPRLQRHPARSALADASSRNVFSMMWRNGEALHGALQAALDARAALPRRLPGVADRSTASARRWPSRIAWGVGWTLALPLARDGVVAVPAAAGALADGSGARRDRQLVRSPLRLPQLRARGDDSRNYAAARLLDARRAVPEQPPPRRGPSQLRRALVRVRPDLRRPPRCSPSTGVHPLPRRRARSRQPA